MADILTSVFRTFMSQTDVNKDVTVVPHSACSALLPGDSSVIRSVLLPGDSSVSSSVLLLGDGSISRSLLLLSAVMAASELGVRVVFFTQTQIQSLPVSLQKCVPSPESLKKIKFSYPRTLGDLLQQVAGLHESQNTSPTPPSLIIVDRLEGFLGGNHSEDQSSAAHLSALLCDTSSFLTHILKQRSPSSAPCRLIASFRSDVDSEHAGGESSATDPILDVLDRYFQMRCTLDRDRSYEAAAAGVKELWNVYLSATGITEDACTKEREDRPAAAPKEWQLSISPDGSMEFKMA
ncbi:hypothetical protein JOQ06_015404 [Pogonophryne albipinna]|uniref:SWIM-type zinc finger 7 associated protein 1 n=1 Tax=Pogonophryne albipinna TaxID=1090488 RepID=A0AAD6AAN6_9TELE|nr:hypothetical protein JOQ06_015404 [Pogonophryne albipinna]